MFKRRAYLLDISRDKVPTLKTLKQLVDLLAGYNYNELQLYTEHTFQYRAHPVVWEDADPMTSEEIHKLDLYCQMQGIDLVPNQNTFGHMERWLVHPEYNGLARFPKGGAITPWGSVKRFPTTLDPRNPGSLKLVESLLDELLPCFSSEYVNINCDETFEISDPREYLGFLLRIVDAARSRGKKVMFWGDIVLKHPELIPELPKDLIALDWGYEGNHPFAKEAVSFKAAGLSFYVCPGTSSWRSLAGRVENMRDNLAAAERAGWMYGATGYMVTDWGDEGHWQPLAASLPGLILGGNFASEGKTAAKMDLEKELNRVMGAPLGGYLLRLGTVYLIGGALRANCSEFFNILHEPHGYSRHPGITESVLNEVSGVASGVRVAVTPYAEKENPWAQEIVYMADLLDAACHRKDEGRLRALRQEHGVIWRLRNKEGGRVDSLAKLPRF